MRVKITVTSIAGYQVEHIADVSQEGDLPEAIAVALNALRTQEPGAGGAAFDSTIRIEHA